MVPDRIVGKELVTLEMIRQHDELYVHHTRKYKGREHVMSHKIPPLNCTANQVLNFTAIHPKKVDRALKEAGFAEGLLKRKWFKINPKLLNPDMAAVFLYRRDLPIEDAGNYKGYEIRELNSYNTLSKETIQYYKEKRTQGIRPLLFHLVPHILYKGTLKISDLEVIRI
jgi:hypothetical protein